MEQLCVPLLTIRTLYQLAIDNEQHCKEASQFIRDNVCVDDLFSCSVANAQGLTIG